jgi:GDP/UDP-N,N'-diacetylbacillosamine 2-epimerase (hydrolysing)
MRSVLDAIAKDKQLQLQIVVTGMHLNREHGKTIEGIRGENWGIDAVVKWAWANRAVVTGEAIAALAKVFGKLKPDVVLVVGDRVEAFAAASAAHLCDIAVAHVHGGDRAMGQMDDSLRHAISKLAHVHFPATKLSAERLTRMGEDRRRIFRVGSPGIDGIVEATEDNLVGVRGLAKNPHPNPPPGYKGRGKEARQFAMVVLHPISADESQEFRQAEMIVRAVRKSGIPRTVVIYPNNDPGSAGIIRCWKRLEKDPKFIVHSNVSRAIFLGLLRDAAMLIGNSSSGIIEAASFRTPVIDIGPRQLGRERCKDVKNVPYRASAIEGAIRNIWNGGTPRRGRWANPYQGELAGRKIAEILAKTRIDQRLLRKVISF